VVEWPDDLLIADPAVIIAAVDRAQRKGGREIMGHCSDQDDAIAAANWLVDRISRLEPALEVRADVEPGGGQYMIVLQSPR
jgi:hypothetical protein